MRLGKKMVMVLMCILLMNGCTGKNQQEEFQMTLSHFKVDQFKEIEDTEILMKADAIMNGQLYVDFYIAQSFPYSMEEFDWNQEKTDSPATFQLYLQSLGMVKYLSKAAELTKKTDYLKLAEQFIVSWDDYAHDLSRSQGNTKVWYDHGTALRAENLISYALTAKTLNCLSQTTSDLIDNLLIEHAQFLMDEKNYTKNHNHGIFQDEALLYIAYYLNHEDSEAWKKTALERLEIQMQYAFTEEYVHVENSSGYCVGVIDLFDQIVDFLSAVSDDDVDTLKQQVKQMTDFYARIFLPNATMVSYGDSFKEIVTENLLEDMNFYGNAELEYVMTSGTQGIQPEKLTAYYPVSGYFFQRETFDQKKFKDSTWLMFKAGYVSKTHKHADDLSFVLYSKGHEIMIDPGMYNYVSGHPYRDYLVSSLAHNTVVIDDKTYSVTVENAEKTGMLKHEKTTDYDYVLAYSEMYDDVSIDRHIYSMNDAIVIFDDIVSDETHKISQLFHLSNDVEISMESKNELLLNIKGTPYHVRIRQMKGNPACTVIQNQREGQISGIASDELDEIYGITTLKYEMKAEHGQFVTVVTIEDEDGNVVLTNDEDEVKKSIHTEDISFDSEKMQLNMNDVVIELKPRVKDDLDDFSWTLEDNRLSVTMNHTGTNEYAWYLIDAQSEQAIEKTSWSTSYEVIFDLPETDVLLKCYMKDEDGIKRDKIIGRWNTQHEFSDAQRLNYVHTKDEIKHLEGNTYLFKAGLEYDLSYSIRWYVYRNGSYYTVMSGNQNDEFECTFDEPGNYTVSYYVKTLHGDYEYWVYPQITIN